MTSYKPSPKKPCGFCGDTGSHALMIFIAEHGQTVVCSDCIKIFYDRIKNLEQTVSPKFTLTRQ